MESNNRNKLVLSIWHFVVNQCLMYAVVHHLLYLTGCSPAHGARRKKLAESLTGVGNFPDPPTLWYAWAIPGWSGNGILGGFLSQQFDFEYYITVLCFSETN